MTFVEPSDVLRGFGHQDATVGSASPDPCQCLSVKVHERAEGTKERIRLYGVDTTEKGQTCDDASGKRYLCGLRAADYLAPIVGRTGQVRCFEEDRDRYGRIVAECSAGNVVINAEMVRSGWAVEYDQYSDGRHDQEEREAKAAKRGMWQGTLVEPAAWLAAERLASEVPTNNASGKCQIKGNISGSGRIYHLPGSRTYSKTKTKTKIDEGRGERWFCSESEARGAGWRAARG